MEAVSKMKVDELRADLSRRGMDAKGKKQELVDRLTSALLAEDKGELEETPTNGSAHVIAHQGENLLTATPVGATEVAKATAEAVTTEEAIETNVAVPVVELSITDAPTSGSVVPSEGPPPSSSAVDTSSPTSSEIDIHIEKRTDSNSVATSGSVESAVNTSADAQQQSESAVGGADTDATASQAVSAASRHIRVDNFQRPLKDRALCDWLAPLLGRPVEKADYWISSLHTHVYLSLESPEEAARCRALLHGQTFPRDNKRALVASFTQVSARDAPTSAEAELRLEEWQPKPAEVKPAIQKTKRPQQTAPPDAKSSSVEKVGGLLVVTKKPLGPTRTVTLLTTALREATVPARTTTLAGSAETGFVTSRFREKAANSINSGGGESLKRKGEDQQQQGGEAKRRMVGVEAEVSSISGGGWGQQQHASSPPPVDIDRLFRKTSTRPALYWLPVSDAVIEKRRLAIQRNGGLVSPLS